MVARPPQPPLRIGRYGKVCVYEFSGRVLQL